MSKIQGEHSIEEDISRIFDPRTKDYFDEVFRCYNAGCYRSSVIILWSVAVCDMLFKLQELSEQYKNKKAKTILLSLEKMRKKEEYSATWETRLFELAEQKTELIDRIVYEDLLYLKRNRNFAAHPVTDGEFQMYDLDKDKARLLIRSTLEGLLIKTPLLPREVFNELIKDLENKSKTPINDKTLKLYLNEEYYGRLTQKVQLLIFKDFWKFLFKLENQNCDENRDINYRAFLLLFDKNPSQFVNLITKEKNHFNRMIAEEGPPVVYLVYFLARHPQIYELLTPQTKMNLERVIEQDRSAYCLAHFTCKNTDEHVEKLEHWMRERNPKIEDTVWRELQNISISSGWIKKVIHLASIYYVASNDCYTANKRFTEVIEPLIEKYDKEDLINLIQGINESSQIYNRRQAKINHQLIVSRMKSLSPSFDFTKFEAFTGYQDQDL